MKANWRQAVPLPLPLRLACQRLGVRWSRHVLVVEIASQTIALFERSLFHEPAPGARTALSAQIPASAKPSAFRRRPPADPRRLYTLNARYRCSTSRFGSGQVANSNCTPLGLHRIARKIGGGWPVGTVFQSRKVVGFTWRGRPLAPITTRILWLEGLEPGFNQGGNVDSFNRYIYLHGTGDEPTLGRPASRGCVHLAATDLIPLYDRLPAGTLVWIQARPRPTAVKSLNFRRHQRLSAPNKPSR